MNVKQRKQRREEIMLAGTLCRTIINKRLGELTSMVEDMVDDIGEWDADDDEDLINDSVRTTLAEAMYLELAMVRKYRG